MKRFVHLSRKMTTDRDDFLWDRTSTLHVLGVDQHGREVVQYYRRLYAIAPREDRNGFDAVARVKQIGLAPNFRAP